ncbi:DUF1918 domain-containing protein [Streptomyces tateyamensis]|uniref:DUF1918 domain-containing protein n=1 Tax=Streptomyces tateyamensis TaxID=565073 RepID=A0A2V4NCW9_9ACTN|nr:DUF1918 domain-containing protein [Streptomyces tateyamensis]
MRATVGDRLIVEGPTTGAPRRDGEIVALHHEDGSPPYDVRWSDTGRTTLLFPGPGAHIHHFVHLEHAEPARTPGTNPPLGRPGRLGRPGEDLGV